VAVFLLILIGVGLWLHAKDLALREVKAREAAAEAARPKRLAPITSSVYVRAVPVRRAQ